MLKTIGFTLLNALLVISAWGKCPTDIPTRSETFKHAKNFVLLDINAATNKTVNVPYLINEKKACYTEQQDLDVKMSNTKDKFIDFELSTLAAAFENIPEERSFHYINIDFDESSKPHRAQFMSFLCSGEIPIISDAFAGSVKKLMSERDTTASPGVFISTGEAAGTNYTIGRDKKEEAKVYDHFLEIYEEKARGENIETSNVFIPNILTGMTTESITETNKKIMAWFFSRTLSSLNACSQKFVDGMQEFQIENAMRSNLFKDITIKKIKSNNYQIRWTL